MEERRKNEMAYLGSPTAKIEDVHCMNLESGESLLLR